MTTANRREFQAKVTPLWSLHHLSLGDLADQFLTNKVANRMHAKVGDLGDLALSSLPHPLLE
jgi:hypothetical protein